MNSREDEEHIYNYNEIEHAWKCSYHFTIDRRKKKKKENEEETASARKREREREYIP